MTEAKPPKGVTPTKRAANARSESRVIDVEPVGVTERASAIERGTDVPIPGSGLVVHRFRQGELAGQPWIGAGGIEIHDVEPYAREIAQKLAIWTEDQKLRSGPYGDSMLDRNAYMPPVSIFDQMRLAARAIENDDVVGSVADGTEAMALNGIHWESSSLDDADVFNQWAQRVDLDFFIRACWRELIGASEYVAARWWGFSTFKVRGTGAPEIDQATGLVSRKDDGTIKKGQRRKKKYDGVYCPQALTLLDPTKVLPLGSTMFGMERLVWTATAQEMKVWQQIQGGVPGARTADPIMANFFTRQYQPDDAEREMIRKLDAGVNPDFLLEMNPTYVWRHTLTRQHYKPWPDIRMKRVFRWLDQKQQLMSADRVALVGNANYILLVKKGEKDHPATQTEIDELNANFAYVAKLPVIIGDHTLSIEIIVPKTDHTLDPQKHAVVNEAIRDSMLATFTFDTGEQRNAAPVTARMISRGMMNRRHGIKRDFEENLGRGIADHPFNAGKFEEDPNLNFTPRNINLDTDQALLQTLVALHTSGDVSRKTTLEEIGYDEDEEARYREVEEMWYDPIFRSATPFNSPDNNPTGPNNNGGPANGGGGELPPGGGGGGRPPGSSTDPTPRPTKRTRPPRGTNRSQQ